MVARDILLRLANGSRKVFAGLKPFSESVWPGVRNDLFVAHESIYRFFAQYVRDRDVLDAGCGTGYGCRILEEAEPGPFSGVDIDRLSVRFASRRYATSRVSFARGDIELLAEVPANAADVVVSSNALEHLHTPMNFVGALQRVLRKPGIALIAVPPILSDEDREVHAAIHYHRSNLSVTQWYSLFADAGFEIICYSHRAKNGIEPNFADRRRSRLSPDDFVFAPASLQELVTVPVITALFELRVSEASHGASEEATAG